VRASGLRANCRRSATQALISRRRTAAVTRASSFDPDQSCAIANVHIEGTKPDAVVKYLFDKHHIFTVPIVHEEFQGIRITPNVYTTLGELDRFCEQMELIARKGLPS
jgi:selenocysteine lyase/cysteine desulfurase